MSDMMMLDVFQQEVEAQVAILNQGLLSLETEPQTQQKLESLMRVVNAINGTAKLVEVDAAIHLSEILENCLNNVQKQKFTLTTNEINVLLQGVDLLLNISRLREEQDSWVAENQDNIATLSHSIENLLTPNSTAVSQPKVEFKNLPTIAETPKSEEILADEWNAQPTPVVAEVPKKPEITSPPVTHQPPPKPVENEPKTMTTEIEADSSEDSSSMGDTSMLELFQLEVDAQATILNEGLLALESQPGSPKVLESLMRAAHSVKGAARIVSLDAAVQLAHVMEDCFVAAQNQKITLEADGVDVLLHGVDLLTNISQQGQPWVKQNRQDIENTKEALAGLLTGTPPVKRPESAPTTAIQGQTTTTQKPEMVMAATGAMQAPTTTANKSGNQSIVNQQPGKVEPAKPAGDDAANADRVVRVSAENLNRIMGLAGESLIEANWLQPFADSLAILKKRQLELSKILELFQQNLTVGHTHDTETYLETARAKERECRQILSDRLIELELYARRTGNLSDRLYQEVIQSNMRPFADGVQGFPRMLRDLARKLNKQLKFEIFGKSTPVDRDIIKKLEAPLTHILRNAIDHGMELPEERIAAGKPPEGNLRLEAVHRGGMLSITISDDGRGINFDMLREKIINKNLATREIAEQLSESELIEFLFLPGFSTAKQVTEISGRGVGLDIAKSMAHDVGGTVRAMSTYGKGTTFHFQLPLTLSVVRTLLVEISGEPYAFPLARIEQIVNVDRKEIASAENRQYFTMDNKNIGLVAAYQVLELKQPPPVDETLSVVVISEQSDYYGLVVDRFLGEHDLVVRPLDSRLGKVQDISAAALMGDGSPILIVDASDLMRSVDNLLNASHALNRVVNSADTALLDQRKTILVVDDSITVREMERKLLQNKGYKVDVAVDGMEGWHAVSTNHYDLVVSDVDMPRMNGIEFTSKIKTSPKLSSIPVIIVSYKDREEDRMRGLEAGADYYLTKASFQDDTLVNAVYDLIGH